MTNDQDMTLVFKDQAGEYYLLPQELLERCRVPAEQKAEIEQLIAEQQDTQGYAIYHGGGSVGWLDPSHAFVNAFFRRLGYAEPFRPI